MSAHLANAVDCRSKQSSRSGRIQLCGRRDFSWVLSLRAVRIVVCQCINYWLWQVDSVAICRKVWVIVTILIYHLIWRSGSGVSCLGSRSRTHASVWACGVSLSWQDPEPGKCHRIRSRQTVFTHSTPAASEKWQSQTPTSMYGSFDYIQDTYLPLYRCHPHWK